jgi:uncharacterized membrane protein YcaP (DUF421 family)
VLAGVEAAGAGFDGAFVGVGLADDELEAAAREHGVASIKDVDLAILERDGNISILSSNYTHRSRRRRVHKSMLKQDN